MRKVAGCAGVSNAEALDFEPTHRRTANRGWVVDPARSDVGASAAQAEAEAEAAANR